MPCIHSTTEHSSSFGPPASSTKLLGEHWVAGKRVMHLQYRDAVVRDSDFLRPGQKVLADWEWLVQTLPEQSSTVVCRFIMMISWGESNHAPTEMENHSLCVANKLIMRGEHFTTCCTCSWRIHHDTRYQIHSMPDRKQGHQFYKTCRIGAIKR